MRHNVVPAVIAGSLLIIASCGDTPSIPAIGDGNGQNPPAQAGDAMVNCGGSEYDPAALADAPPVSSLPEGPAGAVDDAGEPALDSSQDWRVVQESDDRVDLVRELDEPIDQGGGDVRTHESRTLERITGATNVPDGTWMLTSAGPCTQRLVSDDTLADADLTLARSPSPDDTTLELLVHERACASGQSAEGRVGLADLEETADQVRLRIGVQPLGGEQNCQGNPATPFTVELTEPLGDREVVDASVVPARPLSVDAVSGEGE